MIGVLLNAELKRSRKLVAVKTVFYFVFTDRPNEDAIALCEEYLQKLHNLVTECHRVFLAGA